MFRKPSRNFDKGRSISVIINQYEGLNIGAEYRNGGASGRSRRAQWAFLDRHAEAERRAGLFQHFDLRNTHIKNKSNTL